jgi:hypothetical protein
MVRRSQRDMDFKNLADATRARVIAAAGVSKTILGTAESDISELRSKGHVIETSKEKDAYGFAYHRLAPVVNITQPS